MGLGRAILYARDHDVSEFRDVILDACLHCYSYDVQFEGTRADYMYELVGLLPHKAFYHDAILTSLAQVGDDRDAVQRFRFAACMANEGDENAKRTMRNQYNPGPTHGESIGVNFLDQGIPGLLFVAEKMGALFLAKPDEVDIGWVISQSLDAFGEEAAWNALRNAGRDNPRIEAFRKASEASRKPYVKDPVRAELPSMPYAELLKTVPWNKFSLLWQWGEKASDQDLELAAHGLIATLGPKEQLRHLRIFNRRRFPLSPDVLIALSAVESERIGFSAAQALSHITHPDVRNLAFQLVKSNLWWRGESIALLNNNFKAGDHEIVLGWFKAEEDRQARHSLGMDMREFWKQHPDQTTEVPMLQSLYEKGPCSFCRERAVEQLIKLDALTDQIRAECAYDANSDIRDLVC